MGLMGIAGGEIVSGRPIFGTKTVEVMAGKERSIGDLPRADVHASYRHRIVWFSRPELHVPVWQYGVTAEGRRQDA